MSLRVTIKGNVVEGKKSGFNLLKLGKKKQKELGVSW
jgi:hypothetical protein